MELFTTVFFHLAKVASLRYTSIVLEKRRNMRWIFVCVALLVCSVALLVAVVHHHASLASIIAVSIAVGLNLGSILTAIGYFLAAKE